MNPLDNAFDNLTTAEQYLVAALGYTQDDSAAVATLAKLASALHVLRGDLEDLHRAERQAAE